MKQRLNLFLTAVFLAAGTVPALAQVDTGAESTRTPSLQDLAEIDESNLGLDIYQPRFTEAKQLLKVVGEVTDRKVQYTSDKPGSSGKLLTRDRFVVIGNGIGVQDFEQGRREALALLRSMDEVLGQQASAPVDQTRETVTYQPKALGLQSIEKLLVVQTPGIEFTIVLESNTVLMSGLRGELDQALRLLSEVDHHGQQFLLTCYLVQQGDKATGYELPAELATGLEALMPGTAYHVTGSSMVRGSVSPRSRIMLETMLGSAAKPNIPPPRFSIDAAPAAYDAASGRLSLQQCRFTFEQPMTQITATGNGVQMENFSGYTSEKLATDLTLTRGEYAVVGALGAEQKLIVLRFEPLD